MAESELREVELALQAASVAIYHTVQSHIGWVGVDIADHLESNTSEVKGKKKLSTNVSGDAQLALDLLAEAHIERELRKCPLVAGFASEERDDFVTINPEGKYIVVFDPLDGSQNIPPGLSVGAIYGVFEARHINEVKTGSEIVAAGYALFSAALQFAWCTRSSPVSLAQYDFAGAAWTVFVKDHKQPRRGKTYAINEGSCANWDALTQTFVAQHLRGRSVRWMCCMVADVSRQLLQGGCFLYPADKKHPNGRLRLVYEAIPLAMLWEKSGDGVAYATVDGTRVMDVPIPKDDVHARCGIIFLGEDEASAFDRLRARAPAWLGGAADAKARLQQTEETVAAKSEVNILKAALVVGAIFNVVLLLRGAR